MQVSWAVVVEHCPGDLCHSHEVLGAGTDPDVVAPDHEHPSYLRVQYRATDERGLSSTESFRLEPRTADLRLRTRPKGLLVSVAGASHRTGWTGTFIVGSKVSLSAPRVQRRRATGATGVAGWSSGAGPTVASAATWWRFPRSGCG